MSESYELVIRPTKGWLAVDWRGIVRYRDLLFQLVLRDFTAKHKQTVLGPLWAIVHPLLTTVVFSVIFGRVAGISTGIIPQQLFYLSGLLGWSYFSQLLTATSTVLVSNAHLFGKVYFPRLIVPLAGSVSGLITFSIQFGTFLVLFLIYKLGATGHETSIQPTLILIPVLLVHMAMLSLGTGLIIACLTAKYRDLQHLVSFVVQIWMYLTPIVWPVTRLPEQLRWLSVANPMTGVVEAFRQMFFGVTQLNLATYSISFGIAAVIFLLGTTLFERSSRTFIDTV